jgi:hypothetical protein
MPILWLFEICKFRQWKLNRGANIIRSTATFRKAWKVIKKAKEDQVKTTTFFGESSLSLNIITLKRSAILTKHIRTKAVYDAYFQKCCLLVHLDSHAKFFFYDVPNCIYNTSYSRKSCICTLSILNELHFCAPLVLNLWDIDAYKKSIRKCCYEHL